MAGMADLAHVLSLYAKIEANQSPENEFYDYNADPDVWLMPCCGADYDCCCE